VRRSKCHGEWGALKDLNEENNPPGVSGGRSYGSKLRGKSIPTREEGDDHLFVDKSNSLRREGVWQEKGSQFSSGKKKKLIPITEIAQRLSDRRAGEKPRTFARGDGAENFSCGEATRKGKKLYRRGGNWGRYVKRPLPEKKDRSERYWGRQNRDLPS